jgi:putative spermidine/putrescine transport system permease protein
VIPVILFLGAFFLYPLLLTITISFYHFHPLKGMSPAFSLNNYIKFLGDTYNYKVLYTTVKISFIVTISTLVLGYPLAFFMTQITGLKRTLLTICVVAPLMVSVAIRTYGWIIVLADNGALNSLLISLGLLERPVHMIYNQFAVVLGLTEALLPFMALSLIPSLEVIPKDLYRAAAICGAGRLTTFFRVMLPLSVPGIAAGSLLVFAIACSSFVTPYILGGGRIRMMANYAFENVLVTLNWPFGSAIALILLIVILSVIMVQHRLTEKLVGTYR